MNGDMLSKLLDLLVSPATSIAAIYFYDRFIARKRNGVPLKDVAETVTKDVAHGLDLALTTHFDQLRRDLSSTIERATDQGAKGMENAITKLLLQDALRRLGK